MSELYQVKALTRSFGKVEALKGVDLAVGKGERLGIVGGSGSGKTTLIRLLAALDVPTGGTIVFDGEPIRAGKPPKGFRSRVQVVFQDPRSSLDPRMKIKDIVGEPLRSQHRRDPKRVEQVLADVGLEPDVLERYPHEFSGGQRQRIAIARALAPEPEVLIADEPVSALDVLVRDQIIELLGSLTKARGLTLLLVSHDLAVVRRLCDSVLIMNEGGIAESGPMAQVMNHPREDYTRRLLAAVPRLKFGPS
ncbi:MAG: ABC transporter ATP-binding protein [Propionibacteriaceae bacterium]|jgi:peptide/nickel transport system ATP-binding protein|nr:ABC transporter ATP-binding protein [Propionibacteriaceae bacterium]